MRELRPLGSYQARGSNQGGKVLAAGLRAVLVNALARTGLVTELTGRTGLMPGPPDLSAVRGGLG